MTKAVRPQITGRLPRRKEILRSVNIIYDAANPGSTSHFRPTTKGVQLIRAVAGLSDERASLIVAPYGSGKSLAATYALHMIENGPPSRDVLRLIAERLQPVDVELSSFAGHRLLTKTHGVVLAIHGANRSLVDALRNAAASANARLGPSGLGRKLTKQTMGRVDDAATLLQLLTGALRDQGFDRLSIVWDEFGRHLDTLVSEGRASALADVQSLAEFASRSSAIPLTLTLLLHQGMLNYATGTSQSVRSEWKKIEGRFKVIQYVDDSKEVFKLIADVVHNIANPSQLPDADFGGAADSALRFGMFPGFERGELEELFRQAYPLTPSVLYLLPRVSARVAQNERTLFNFLYGVNLQEPVHPDTLYDYFSADMRADTSIGGTYRQWLETQSALSKLGADGFKQVVLKTACLLAFGISGERTRVGREQLAFAAGAYDDLRVSSRATSDLIARKLLLHRKHIDDVAVWHGTDVDIRGRLDNEILRTGSNFNLTEFLVNEAPPPVWKPTKYNDDFYTRRYFAAEYLNGSNRKGISDELSRMRLNHSAADGLVVYCAVANAEDVSAAAQVVETAKKDRMMVCAVPRESIPVYDAAVEVAALLNLQRDGALISSDPLVLPELQQLTDDARANLQRTLDRLITPSPDGPIWYHRGKAHEIDSSKGLRDFLSKITKSYYSSTPRINSEAIVRRKLTSVQINARKKLLVGILESSGQPDLRLSGFTPDVAMLRTVLLNTGLYRPNGASGAWRYAIPDEIPDDGLREVWGMLKEFFSAAAPVPKRFEDLFGLLASPPYGVREGVYPILVAAAIRAFPADRAIIADGNYLEDILPSSVEEMCSDPKKYRLRVLDLSPRQRTYLQGLCEYFYSAADLEIPNDDLIRTCFEALGAWRANLPPAALTARSLSANAIKFQQVLSPNSDPVELFLSKLPETIGISTDKSEQLLDAIRGACDELVGVADGYREHARTTVRRLLGFAAPGKKSPQEIVSRWTRFFPDDLAAQLGDMVIRRVLLESAKPGRSDDEFLDYLSLLVVGKAVDHWDDVTPGQFERGLQDIVHRVEQAAMDARLASPYGAETSKGLVGLIEGRLREQYDRLAKITSPEQARSALKELLGSKSEAKSHDDDN